jgi:hypothetical protein
MEQPAGGGLSRVLMWQYERGSWQYDVLCALIVLFILLTPRQFFRRVPGSDTPPGIQVQSSPAGERTEAGHSPEAFPR